MIVLFMVVSFVIGCVDRMCQSFLAECVFLFFSIIAFGRVVLDFDLVLPVGDTFFKQDDKWNCQLVIGLRQDIRVIILLF